MLRLWFNEFVDWKLNGKKSQKFVKYKNIRNIKNLRRWSVHQIEMKN